MTILLTGGAGFIGSTLTPCLLTQGHTVLIVDNFNDSYDPALKRQNMLALRRFSNWRLYEGDIRNQPLLDQIFRANAVDVVVHLAGLAGVRPSLLNPAAYYDHNLNGTSVLLDAMRTANVDRLVFASSSSVYGERTRGSFRETDRTDEPMSPYALSKRAAELLCHQHYRLYGLNAYCLRLFTVYGPRQRPDMAISRFIHQLHTDQPLTLYGDGRSQRDYTYVDDVVGGIVRAIERVDGFDYINLGGASPISLIGLVRLLEGLTNRRATIDWLPDQPGDVPYTHADIQKARHLLDYQPATDLITGLGEMVRQYEQTNACAGVLA